MECTSICQYFVDVLERDEDKAPAVAAIETLYEELKSSQATTVTGLTEELRGAVRAMLDTDHSTASISSASELFMRFISLASLDQPTFSECKRVLLERGEQFIRRVKSSRDRIVEYSQPFIKHNSKILTHSYSRVVCAALTRAAGAGRSFHVFVTQSAPDGSGETLIKKLNAARVPCTLVLDGAAGYLLERMDFVLFGAEGVMETGGIINKIGSFGIAVCARAMNKPVYVMAESVKFVKEYPMNQRDIPESFKYPTSVLSSGADLNEEHPLVDYTPPEYIKLLFTDLGILTPAAVSDELIKLYL